MRGGEGRRQVDGHVRSLGDRIMKARWSMGHGVKGRRAKGGMGLFGLMVKVDGGAGF